MKNMMFFSLSVFTIAIFDKNMESNADEENKKPPKKTSVAILR